jgi:hypothetical protein
VNFNSTDPAANLSAEDLTTSTNGPVKLQSIDGDITVNPGTVGTNGITANGSGDILLQTLGSGRILVDAPIVTTTGDISIKSAEDLALRDNYSTSGTGTFYFSSGRDISWATGVDTLRTNGTSVRLVAGRDILLKQIDADGTGDVGLSAANDIIDSNDTVTINTRNVFARNLVMIADSDNSTAGIIGGSNAGNPSADANINAIDTQVVSLAASSATGIYVRELAAGVTIGTTSVAVREVNFNSTDPAANLSAEDLTTSTNGPVKLQSIDGDITINAGTPGTNGITADGTGDILLQTQNTGDIRVNANVESGSGNITLVASDDIGIAANIKTQGTGTVYLLANNNTSEANSGVLMNSGTRVETANGNILVVAGNEGDVKLGLLITGAGDVGIRAEGSIKDNNPIALSIDATAGQSQVTLTSPTRLGIGDLVSIQDNDSPGEVFTVTGIAGNVVTFNGNLVGSMQMAQNALLTPVNYLNIQANRLSMLADSNSNSFGSIGTSDIADATPYLNRNAIDTQVTTLAAKSAQGIYVREANAVTIDSIPANSNFVRQVNFNSTSDPVNNGDFEDLTTTNNGPIKLVSENGTITVNAGTAGTPGISANGTGDILVETRGTASDVIVNGLVRSDTGRITLEAGRNITINAAIQSVGKSNEVTLKSNLGSIDVGAGSPLAVGTEIVVEAKKLVVQAGKHVHLILTDIDTLEAAAGENGKLESFEVINQAASKKGNMLLSEFREGRVEIRNTQETVPNLLDFSDKYRDDGYSIYLRNVATLSVAEASAKAMQGIGLMKPNIYLETLRNPKPNSSLPTPSPDLIVSGKIETFSVGVTTNSNDSSQQGGIVLIAAADLKINPTADLKTSISYPESNFVQIVKQKDLHAKFENGGVGVEPRYTSEFVLGSFKESLSDLKRHVYQQVAVTIGTKDEIGFLAFVGYSDKTFQTFDVRGEVNPDRVGGGKPPNSYLAPNISLIPAGYNHPILATTPVTPVSGVDLLVRNTPNSSLLSNQTLETKAILRRSADFFMFENTDSGDAGKPIKDLAISEIEDITGVKAEGNSLGVGVPGLPVSVPIFVQQTPIAVAPASQVLYQNIVEEIPEAVDRQGEVLIYRVWFDDIDNDAQPDDDELPTPEGVLEQSIGNGPNQRVLVERPEKIKPLQLSPTQADIERIKDAIQSDINWEVGAYSIIQKDPDGNENVLDIFPVRDDSNESLNSEDPAMVIPELNNGNTPAKIQEDKPNEIPTKYDDQAFWLPRDPQDKNSADNHSQASAGLLLGALLLQRRSNANVSTSENNHLTPPEVSLANPASDSIVQTGFCKQDRMRRRLMRLLHPSK